MHTWDERLTKLGLMTVFGAAVTLSSQWQLHIGGIDFLWLGLALMRLGRITAFEGVAEPLRAIVAQEEDHEHYGTTTEPRFKTGWRRSLGELVTCPMCAATWWALVLSIGLCVVPEVAWRMVTIMAAVGVMEIANSSVEALCWNASANRKRTGEK